MQKKRSYFILIFLLCLLYELGYSYTLEGKVDENSVWVNDESEKGWFLNTITAELTKGTYEISLDCINDTDQDIRVQVKDMEHNNGKNQLGKVIAKKNIEKNSRQIIIPFHLTEDSNNIQIQFEEKTLYITGRLI